MSLESMAEALYGGSSTPSTPAGSTLTTSESPPSTMTPAQIAMSTPAPAAPPAPANAPPAAPSGDGAIAEKLFGADAPPGENPTIPPHIAELRESEGAAGKMYRPGYDDIIKPDVFVDSEGAPAEVQAAATAELKNIFNDVGASPAEAREVIMLAQQLRTEPPTPELEAQWRAEISQRLIEQEGSVEAANAALRLAQKLAQRDPRVAAMLQTSSRLGSHPKVVELMIARARSESVRGRLK